MDLKPVHLLALLALILSAFMAVRIHKYKNDFKILISSSDKITEGYVERFLSIIQGLEEDLATRNNPEN